MTLDELFSAAVDASAECEHTEAERLWDEFLSRSGLTEAHPGYDPTVYNVGGVKRDLGKFEEARAIYTGLLSRVRARGDAQMECGALHELAMVERFSGNYEGALEGLERVATTLQAKCPDGGEASALNLTQRAHLVVLGNPEEGRALLERALVDARNTSPDVEASVLQGLGELAAATGNTLWAQELAVSLEHYRRTPGYGWLVEHLKTLLSDLRP